LYWNNVLFLSKDVLQKFFTIEDVQFKLKEKGLGFWMEEQR